MDIKDVCAAWFTGTGTTKKIVRAVGEQMAEELNAPYREIDFSLPQNREKPLDFKPYELVIIGVPTIAGRVPNVLVEYLKQMYGKKALGIPVVLFGNRDYDDALIELRDIMEAAHLYTIAAAAFVGEHAFSDTLAVGRPDAQDMAEAGEFAERAAELVEELDELPDGPVRVTGVHAPYREHYKPKDRDGNPIDVRKAVPKTKDDCDNCGTCADICPMGCISHEDATKIEGICITCNACVKGCPKHAKYFDDEGYLYHRRELEALYSRRRCVPEMFFWEKD